MSDGDQEFEGRLDVVGAQHNQGGGNYESLGPELGRSIAVDDLTRLKNARESLRQSNFRNGGRWDSQSAKYVRELPQNRVMIGVEEGGVSVVRSDTASGGDNTPTMIIEANNGYTRDRELVDTIEIADYWGRSEPRVKFLTFIDRTAKPYIAMALPADDEVKILAFISQDGHDIASGSVAVEWLNRAADEIAREAPDRVMQVNEGFQKAEGKDNGLNDLQKAYLHLRLVSLAHAVEMGDEEARKLLERLIDVGIDYKRSGKVRRWSVPRAELNDSLCQAELAGVGLKPVVERNDDRGYVGNKATKALSLIKKGFLDTLGLGGE